MLTEVNNRSAEMPQIIKRETQAVRRRVIWTATNLRVKWARGEMGVLESARAKRVPPREAALELARARIQRAMDLRRWQS